MRGPKPPALSLSEEERKELKALVRRHSTPQQLALRGRIILAADAGQSFLSGSRPLSLPTRPNSLKLPTIQEST